MSDYFGTLETLGTLIDVENTDNGWFGYTALDDTILTFIRDLTLTMKTFDVNKAMEYLPS